MPRYNLGITFTETLLCISLIAILSMIAIPDMAPWLARNEISGLAEQYRNAIGFARAQAIIHGSTVSFCPSHDGQRCQGSDWSDGGIIFTDHDANREIDSNDELLRTLPASRTGADIRFRSFGNRQYLQLTPQGFTHYQNGNFTLCPADLDPRQAQQLIITTTARVRFARDTDGDGIRENSQGQPLTCP